MNSAVAGDGDEYQHIDDHSIQQTLGTTLAADLSELVDDMEYADVCFYTSDNTPIYAHMYVVLREQRNLSNWDDT